jgi:hypothetical protein
LAWTAARPKAVLFESPVMTAARPAGSDVVVAIEGVKRLTLKVTHAGNSDLGDVADWGSARVVRDLNAASAKGEPK